MNSRRSETPKAVAISCKMVGGGSDGSLDICGRVCIIDEDENIIFHTFVKPQIPITNYRYEKTGIRAEYIRDAMPVKQVQRQIQDFLYNGEALWKIRMIGGKARILVGHGLDRDLESLGMEYPVHLTRNGKKKHGERAQQKYPSIAGTAFWAVITLTAPIDRLEYNNLTRIVVVIVKDDVELHNGTPLSSLLPWKMTPSSLNRNPNGVGISTIYVGQYGGNLPFLKLRGYENQSGIQDPYDDCVASMRLYARMRSQTHPVVVDDYSANGEAQHRRNFAACKLKDLEKMTPDALLEMSRSDYYCWCLDTKRSIARNEWTAELSRTIIIIGLLSVDVWAVKNGSNQMDRFMGHHLTMRQVLQCGSYYLTQRLRPLIRSHEDMLTSTTSPLLPSLPSLPFSKRMPTPMIPLPNTTNARQSLLPHSRRHLLLSLSLCPSLLLSLPIPAVARGLFQMPPPRLVNRYFLVRAGESEYESLGILNTNPVAKTSVDSGLSERGKRQTARAALELKKVGACDGDCWIWPSITQRSYQAAEIIAAVNDVSRRKGK
ncbi:hypothetical protein ACLOJK_032461 [Asimina triloba]